jgi:ATP-binding cassette, subfamily B (MDR/TAP), member 1
MVVELGNHDELVAKNGLYADLVRLQMTGHDDDAPSLSTDGGEGPAEKSDIVASSKETGDAADIREDPVVVVADEASGGAVDKKAVALLDKAEAKKLRQKMWSLVYPYLPWFIVGLLGAAMVGAAFPIWGLLLATTQDMFYYRDTQRLRDESVVIAGRFVMLGVNCLLGYTLQYFCIAQVGQRISTQLRSDMFESFLRRDMSFFDYESNSAGSLTTRLADDARLVHEASGETLSNQLQAIFTLMVGLIIGFTASWQITLVVIATFPLNIIASAIRMKARTGQAFEVKSSLPKPTIDHGNLISAALNKSQICRGHSDFERPAHG